MHTQKKSHPAFGGAATFSTIYIIRLFDRIEKIHLTFVNEL